MPLPNDRISLLLAALLCGAAAPTKTDKRGENAPERIHVVGHAHSVATRASTATKTDTPLIETTQTVSVVTRAFMDDMQAQTLDAALRYTAGVQPSTYGNDSRFDWLRIRGFDATTYGLYLDGMRFSPGSTGPAQEQYGLERIEVLNGPASVLYGQASPGGLVNMVSKTPTATPSREVEFLTGSYSRYQGQADIGGMVPGAGGALDGRIVFLARDSDTQVDRVKDNRLYVAPSLTWHVTPETDVTFLSWYQHDHTSGIQFLPAYGTVFGNPNGKLPTSLFTGSPDLDKWDRNQGALGFLLDHRLNSAWTFHQSFRLLHLDLDWGQAYGAGLLPDLATLDRYAFHQINHADIYTSDTRLTGHARTGPVAHVLLFGLDYSRVAGSEDYSFEAGTPLNLYAPVYVPQPAFGPATRTDQVSTQTGLYFQDQMKIAGRVIVMLGGRYDWAGTDARTTVRGASSDSAQSDNVFTYRGGLGYLFPVGLMTYVSYSRSFEPTSGVNFYGQALKPTTGKQVELGMKYQPHGIESFLTASLFELREQNVSTADPANPLNTLQTGEIRVRGFEASANVSLGSGIDLVAAYTYLDPVITASNRGTEGNTPQLVPHHTASLWGDYAFGPQGPAPLLAGLGLGLGVRYLGSTEANDQDAFRVPSATLFDAAMHYDFGRGDRWRLAVNLNNMFDRTYVASCTGYTSCYYGDRRQVLGSVRLRF